MEWYYSNQVYTSVSYTPSGHMVTQRNVKILQQAIYSVSDDVESLYDSLLQLEQDKGCLSVCIPLVQNIGIS